MPLIMSFERDGQRYFFDYGTIVDAPTSYAMTRAEYMARYKAEHGRFGEGWIAERLDQAEVYGVSDGFRGLNEALTANCAGPGGTRLAPKQVLDLVMASRPTLPGAAMHGADRIIDSDNVAPRCGCPVEPWPLHIGRIDGVFIQPTMILVAECNGCGATWEWGEVCARTASEDP